MKQSKHLKKFDETTKRKKALLLEALEKFNGTAYKAIDAVGVSSATYYRYYDEDKDFRDEVNRIKEVILDKVEEVFVNDKILKDKDTASIIFFLKTKGKHRGYSERIEQSVTIQQKGLIDTSRMSDAELLLKLEEIKKLNEAED